MEVTFWGVRGTVPSPGPATVRYGGNTACTTVRLGNGELLILDCGTGARNLGLALMAGPFGQGKGRATLILSLAHWDHIQGFPFFGPLYIRGNRFTIYGPSDDAAANEGIIEGQMAAQYFPVQTIKNMAANIELKALEEGRAIEVAGARITACRSRPGPMGAFAFRIEEAGRALVYAGHAGADPSGPSPAMRALLRNADVLVHDSTFTPEDRRRYRDRGLASVEDAVDAAIGSSAKKLVLFHYDQDYSDPEVDALIERARQRARDADAEVEILGAAEGKTLAV